MSKGARCKDAERCIQLDGELLVPFILFYTSLPLLYCHRIARVIGIAHATLYTAFNTTINQK